MATRRCSIEDCSNDVVARGWCSRHYEGWRNYGDPLALRRSTNGAGADWIKTIPADAVCGSADWPFPTVAGYGQLLWEGKKIGAHRAVLLLHVGEPPKGKPWALHLCRRPLCCAPRCLRWGSARENSRDMVEHGTHWCAKLNLAKAQEMREQRLLHGTTYKALAEMFGVSQPTVHKVLSGQSWKPA